MTSEVFHTYDIRGIFEKELTTDLAEKIGKAFGTLVDGEEVIVGYDTRTSSPKIFESFSKGVLSTGKDVTNVGMLPTPLTYFSGFNQKLPGAMITASHNPPEYNGIKFFRKDGTSLVEELKELKEITLKENFKKGVGEPTDVDYGILDYLEYLQKKIEIQKEVKMVAECFHGAASVVTPYIFKSNNIRTIAINNNILGDFGGLRPEPKKDNLRELAERVIKENADFGVAFDGDADRAVFIDNKGRLLNGAETGAIFLQEELKRKKGPIIATIDCPSGIARIAEENGGKVIWTRIGHGFIEENLTKHSAVFGFEQSAHFYFNRFFPFSDGLLSALRMAEIIADSGRKLSDIADELKLNPTEKIYIHVGTHNKKNEIIERVRKRFPDAEDWSDGIKIWLNEKEWVLIRASQTNPEINIAAERKNKKDLERTMREYTKLITSLKTDI